MHVEPLGLGHMSQGDDTPPVRTLAEEWRDFYTTNLKPRNASFLQQVITRRAFYAGAASMFGLVMEITAESVSADEYDALLSKLKAELTEFGKAIQERRV